MEIRLMLTLTVLLACLTVTFGYHPPGRWGWGGGCPMCGGGGPWGMHGGRGGRGHHNGPGGYGMHRRGGPGGWHHMWPFNYWMGGSNGNGDGRNENNTDEGTGAINVDRPSRTDPNTEYWEQLDRQRGSNNGQAPDGWYHNRRYNGNGYPRRGGMWGHYDTSGQYPAYDRRNGQYGSRYVPRSNRGNVELVDPTNTEIRSVDVQVESLPAVDRDPTTVQ